MLLSNKQKTYNFGINKKTEAILLILFVISRVVFINSKSVLFDSKEYLDLFANPKFSLAITTMHTPLHEGYMFMFWPVFQIAKHFTSDPAYFVVITQIVLATITIYCYYKFISLISNNTTALFSSIIIALTPLFWITNVTITIEISYVSAFFVSLYFLTKYILCSKNIYLYISVLLLTYSALTYSAVILWIPVYLCISFYKKKSDSIKIFTLVFLSLLFFGLTRIIILSRIFNTNPFLMFHALYTSNITQVGSVKDNFDGLLILIRNFIPNLRNYTSIVFIISLISLIFSYKTNKKIFFLCLLWVIPILYTNQWWDSVFMGRYSILTGFCFSFLTGYFINRYRFLSIPLFFYMLLVSVPALFLLKTATPYLQEAQYVKTLPKNSLLIESHFALPVLQNCCQFKILGVNRPDIGNPKIRDAINNYLKNKRPVFVSSAAISDPYGLYTGPYLHPLSLSYQHDFELKPLLINYRWKVYKIINANDNLIMYQILAHGNSDYPYVKNMQRQYRRLDYYDPITRIWWYLEDLFSSRKKK